MLRRIATSLILLAVCCGPARGAEFNDLYERQSTAGLDHDIGVLTLETPLDIDFGGLGIVFTDPNADRILFWDDSAGNFASLTVGSGLSLSDTTLTATGGGGGGGGTLSMIALNGSQVGDADIEKLDFSSEFGVSESPDTEINITIDSSIARDSEVNGYFSDPSTNGSFSASNWRGDLGLTIGSNVQAYDADLTTWAGITPSANVQSFNAASDYAAMRTLLSLVPGTNVQAYDADLDDLADGSLTGTKVAQGTTSGRGTLEVATPAEAAAGTDTALAVTPEGLKAALDTIAVSKTLTGLGLTPMHGASGTGDAVGEANLTALMAYWDGDFRATRLPIEVPMAGWIFSGTLYTGASDYEDEYTQIFGRNIRFAGGGGYPIAELQGNDGTATIGGEVARLVCRDVSELDVIAGAGSTFIVIDSYATVIEGGANIWGAWDADNANDISFDNEFSAGTLTDAQAHALYPDVGVLIAESDGNGVGNGKLNAQNFTAAFFDTAIQCATTATDSDNADQLKLDDFRAIFCYCGIRLVNQQALGITVDYYEGIHVPKMLIVQRGGKVVGDHWVVETPHQTMVESWTPQGNESGYNFQKVTIDTGADGDCIVWKQLYEGAAPWVSATAYIAGDRVKNDTNKVYVCVTGGTSAGSGGPTGTGTAISDNTVVWDYLSVIGTGGAESMKIGELHCSADISQYTDTFQIGPWGKLTIESGKLLTDDMFRFNGGVDTHKPSLHISNCAIRDCTDPYDIISPNTTGAYTVTFENNTTGEGIPIPDRKWTVSQGGTITVISEEAIVETLTTASPTLKVAGATNLNSASNAVNGTLPSGSFVGQMKTVTMTNAANSSTLTVTNHQTSDPEVFTFDAVGETLVLVWNGTDWCTVPTTTGPTTAIDWTRLPAFRGLELSLAA